MIWSPKLDEGAPPAGLRLVLGLVPGLGNSFWNVIINAVEDVLIRAGYGVIFGDSRSDPVREAHYHRLLRSGQIDGLLFFNPRPDFGRQLFDIGLPTAVVFNDIPELDRVPIFGVANREAAATMIDYLIGLGHRRIAHIAGPEQNLDALERLRGYGDALAAAGVAVDQGLIWRGGDSFVAGAKAARRYLALDADRRPTAIFAASDEMAVGCVSALREAGVEVPGQVSVAGFDGVDFSAMFEPPLTTMLQPRAELGRLATEDLVRQLEGEAPRPCDIRLPCKLVIRQSVSRPGRPGPAPERRGGEARSRKTFARR
jgi:LacI family repressor for deo operon, udp, cdd, tsx, nupC, and nupG